MRGTMASTTWRSRMGNPGNCHADHRARRGYDALLEHVRFDYSNARSIVLAAKNHGIRPESGI